MVQVFGRTYRIVRVTPGSYEAVRLSDDVRMGTFSTQPPMRLSAETCDERLLGEIAHAALRQARTSWSRHQLGVKVASASEPKEE